jgi:aminoglycoside phosphotransferase
VNGEVFPAVEPASVVYDRLQLLRDVIRADPGLKPGAGDIVQAELIPVRRTRSGQIGRFYWSAQHTTAQAPLGFHARTLYEDHRLAQPAIFDFPDEPIMTWLSADGAMNGALHGAQVQVLRYIPCRRVTFRAEQVSGLPGRVIVKTQRRSSLLHATRVLLAVRRAARQTDSGGSGGVDGRIGSFAVPRPIRLDAKAQMLYLEELPGSPLTEVFDQDVEAEAMHRLGKTHRRLHELDVAVDRSRSASDWLASAAAATTSIAVFLPSLARRMAGLYEELARTVPDHAEHVFCQGDFDPSQILCDSSRWSVLDFDDAHLADPWAEVAALYVALPQELSLSNARRAEGVRDSYVMAYIEAAGQPPSAATWRWYVLVAQLRNLARRLTKGRALPGEAEEVLDAIDSGELRLPA